jgi:hypothetical protein
MLRHILPFLLLLPACTSQQDKDRIAQLEKQTKELQEQLQQQRRTMNLESQEKCADGARKSYLADGWDKAKANTLNSYTNHYNEKLNRCFIEVVSTQITPSTGRIFTSRQVSDAFEGRLYSAIYINKTKEDPPGSLPVFQCELNTPSGEKKSCRTVEEYETFIKQYMN